MSLCKNCGCETPKRKPARKFCCTECLLEYNKKQQELKYKEDVARWKAGLDDGMRGATSIKHFIRRYLFEKYEGKCARCGWHEVNPTTGNCPLEVEHIDGNHENNAEENLTLLCPNCHSLTSTYKSLNKGKGRNRRKYNEQYKKV